MSAEAIAASAGPIAAERSFGVAVPGPRASATPAMDNDTSSGIARSNQIRNILERSIAV